MSPTIVKLKRCKHVHYSGRRCEQPTSQKAQLCGLHRPYTACTTCESMLNSFIPPKGW